MSISMLNRRKALLGGTAALAVAALSRRAVAARKSGPGGFSQAGLAKIPETLGHLIDSGAAVGLVMLLYRHGEIAQVNTLLTTGRRVHDDGRSRDAVTLEMGRSSESGTAAMLCVAGDVRGSEPAVV